MDRIILRGVHCRLRVGVSKDERGHPQDCLVDVELEYDLSRAMETDDVRDTLNYARVLELVRGLAREEEFALLERFAGRLEMELRRELDFGKSTIRVKKLRPPGSGALEYAGIEIQRFPQS